MSGYDSADVWRMTPRQMAAILFVAQKRRERQMAELLAMHSMAARGEPKEIRKLLKAMTDGA